MLEERARPGPGTLCGAEGVRLRCQQLFLYLEEENRRWRSEPAGRGASRGGKEARQKADRTRRPMGSSSWAWAGAPSPREDTEKLLEEFARAASQSAAGLGGVHPRNVLSRSSGGRRPSCGQAWLPARPPALAGRWPSPHRCPHGVIPLRMSASSPPPPLTTPVTLDEDPS